MIGVIFLGEGILGATSMEEDRDFSLVNEQVIMEGRNGGVSGHFLNWINAPGCGAEYFDEEDGLVLVCLIAGVAVAGNQSVGIVEIGDAFDFDANVGVAVGGTARGSAELVAETQQGIERNIIVIVAGSGHGMHGAAEIFVFLRVNSPAR